MFCRYCGTANPADSRFCRRCGKQFDATVVTLRSDSTAPVQQIPGIPISGIQPAAADVPVVRGTPQMNAVPSVQGAPSPLNGHPNAASSAPFSSPAPQESLHVPNTSAPSLPPRTQASSQIGSHDVTHPLPESPPHGYHPSHSHLHPHSPTEGHTQLHTEHHPHTEPRQHPHAEHHSPSQPFAESQLRSTSLQSIGTQQALSTGVKAAGHISRRAFLIALGVAAAGTVAVGAVVYVNNAISTPEKTITAFLEAVKRRDGQAAYEQLSSRLQSQINEQQYISSINLVGGFIGSYTISNVQENSSTATATVSFTALIITANYSVELVKENDVWKIDGGTLINYH